MHAHPFRLSLSAAVLVLGVTACQPNPSTPSVPIEVTGKPTETAPSKEVPEQHLKQLALIATQAAAIMPPALQKLGVFTLAYLAAYEKYYKPSYRVLSGIPDWDYRNGWYWHQDNNGEQTLRVHIEGSDGQGTGWDVTDPANYTPDYFSSFPTHLMRFRLELDQALPSGARAGLSFQVLIPRDKNGRLEAFGTGAVAATGGIGHIAFEALNASLPATGAVEHGDLVLKALREGVTYQLTGSFAANGLNSGAKAYRNAQYTGELVQQDGRWQLRNEGGTYGLENQ